MTHDIKLFVHSEADVEKAGRIAEKTKAEITYEVPDGLHLFLDGDRLGLSDGKMDMCADFSGLIHRISTEKLNGESLIKAAKIKGGECPRVADATAGTGEDAFLLAAKGCEVDLIEYNPVISTLLENALERAKADERLSPIAERMHLITGDSTEILPLKKGQYRLIYLDPMFPERKKSGLIKKKFQLLQQLETPCGDEEKLFSAALQATSERIIVKRMESNPFLAGRKPDYSVKGKTVRFDVYIAFPAN